MNPKTKPTQWKDTATFLLASSLLALPVSLTAQETAATEAPTAEQVAVEPETPDDTVELSPFVVSGDTDEGYRATSTLAGTRLRTDLRDIGSSISIVNKEFLQDTNSTTIAEVLLFTPNTEVSGMKGNYSGTRFGAGVLIPEDERDFQGGGRTRIRGLANADLTRNYFITNLPFDTYNVDRVEVQRGANSALFGLGSPGGIVNHSTLLPSYERNRSRIRFEADQFGTLRGSFRTNQALGDRVAVSVAGLYSDKKFEQKEAYEDDRRIYAAINIKVIAGISVFGNIEDGTRDRSRYDFVPPNDGISPWLDIGSPVFDSPALAGSLYRDTGTYLPNTPNSQILTLSQSGTSSGYASIYGDPNNPGPTQGVLAFGRTNTGLPAPYPVGTGEWMQLQPRNAYEIVRLTGMWPDGTPAAPGEAPFFARNNVGMQLLDRSIFDYRKHLFSGGTSKQHLDWLVYQVGAEGVWLDDRLGIELTYANESSNDSGFNALQGAYQRTIFIDPNQYLIGTVNEDGTSDGLTGLLPNPGYGQPTMGGLWGGNKASNELTSTRATAFAEIRANDFLEEGTLSSILGRLKLTGLLEQRKASGVQHYARDQVSSVAVANATYPGGRVNGTAAPNFGVFRAGSQYVLPYSGSQDLLSGSSLSDYSGINIGPVPFGDQRDRPPAYMTYQGWSTDDNAFVNFASPTFTLDDAGSFPASFSSSKRDTDIDSKVVVGQWHIWENTLVLTASWRDDTSKTAGVGAPGSTIHPRADNIYDPAYVLGPVNLQENGSRSTTSWSVMLHTPQFIKDSMPWGSEISLYASEASNFSPGGGGLYIDNTPIAPTTGDTKEAGIIISTLNGKLIGRFNWYETGVLNKTFDAGGVSANEGILTALVTGTVRQENIDNGWTVADSQAVLPSQGVQDLNQFQPNWSDGTVLTNRDSFDNGTQDFVSKGSEWEITYNPSQKWTWLLSVGKQETITSNTYPVLKPYSEGFVQTNWVDSAFAKSYIVNDQGETLSTVAQRNITDPVGRAVLQDGNPQIEQRALRVNINTSYNFGMDSGLPDWLGNLSIGGGYRWQDKVGVGFGVSQNEFGDYVQDIGKPLYGGKVGTVDLFFRSRYQLSNEQTLTLQLNIGDVLSTTDLIPIYANPDNSKVFRFTEGRMFNLTATWEF